MENEIKQMRKYLCKAQEAFLRSFPARENIAVYDWQLDLEENEDFAIWECELNS